MSVMRIPIDVTYTDGRRESLVAMPLEIMKFEREFNMSMAAFSSPEGRRVEYMLFLAYSAASRTADVGTFDEWASRVADLDPGEREPEGSDPLDQGPSTGS